MTKEQAASWAAVVPVTVRTLVERTLRSTDDELEGLFGEPEDDRAGPGPYGAIEYALRKADDLRLNSPSGVDDLILADLERRMCGSRWEREAWDAVLRHLPRPLPVALANRLIDRKVGVDLIGHRWEDESILWRLAPVVDEALLTLAKHRYRSPAESVERLLEVFEQYPTHAWMLESLTLETPSGPEKQALLVEYLKRHPDPKRVARYRPELIVGA
jgi:hypothetical protein